MRIKQWLAVLIHISLLGGSILFVKQTIYEYIQGSTFYSVTKEPITLHDLPTLTICWVVHIPTYPPRAYGKDFSIEVKLCEDDQETTTLLEDKKVKTLSGLEMYLTELHLRNNRGEM